MVVVVVVVRERERRVCVCVGRRVVGGDTSGGGEFVWNGTVNDLKSCIRSIKVSPLMHLFSPSYRNQ